MTPNETAVHGMWMRTNSQPAAVLLQGLASTLMHIAADSNEDEAVLCLVTTIICQAAARKRNMKFFGGAPAVAELLLSLLRRAQAPSDASGRGCWLNLLSVASRGLAQLADSAAGRLALAELNGAAALLSVLRLELRVLRCTTLQPQRTLQPCTLPNICGSSCILHLAVLHIARTDACQACMDIRRSRAPHCSAALMMTSRSQDNKWLQAVRELAAVDNDAHQSIMPDRFKARPQSAGSRRSSGMPDEAASRSMMHNTQATGRQRPQTARPAARRTRAASSSPVAAQASPEDLAAAQASPLHAINGKDPHSREWLHPSAPQVIALAHDYIDK